MMSPLSMFVLVLMCSGVLDSVKVIYGRRYVLYNRGYSFRPPLRRSSNSFSERIIGGYSAQQGSFPYQISLKYIPQNGRHWCGGAIIDTRWILTAAHCVRGKDPSKFKITAGTVALKSGGESYSIDRIILHEGFKERNKLPIHDLALLRTSTHIRFTDQVMPISLGDFEVKPGSEMLLSGWGYVSYPKLKTPDTLQYLRVMSIGLNMCTKAVRPHFVWKHNICTISERNQGACRGDSGGPLVFDGYLVGVVSWGRPCARGTPDVFTRVSSYVPWIKRHIS